MVSLVPLKELLRGGAAPPPVYIRRHMYIEYPVQIYIYICTFFPSIRPRHVPRMYTCAHIYVEGRSPLHVGVSIVCIHGYVRVYISVYKSIHIYIYRAVCIYILYISVHSWHHSGS